MSLVMTAISTRSRKRRQSASTSAVFPDPTGPPMPIFNGLGVIGDEGSRAEQPHLEIGVRERGQLESRREAPHLIGVALGRPSRELDDERREAGEDSLAVELTER